MPGTMITTSTDIPTNNNSSNDIPDSDKNFSKNQIRILIMQNKKYSKYKKPQPSNNKSSKVL